MPKQKVTIALKYTAWRTMTIEVEAPSMKVAVDRTHAAADPEFDDPRWKTEWQLHSSQVWAGDKAG